MDDIRGTSTVLDTTVVGDRHEPAAEGRLPFDLDIPERLADEERQVLPDHLSRDEEALDRHRPPCEQPAVRLECEGADWVEHVPVRVLHRADDADRTVIDREEVIAEGRAGHRDGPARPRLAGGVEERKHGWGGAHRDVDEQAPLRPGGHQDRMVGVLSRRSTDRQVGGCGQGRKRWRGGRGDAGVGAGRRRHQHPRGRRRWRDRCTRYLASGGRTRYDENANDDHGQDPQE